MIYFMLSHLFQLSGYVFSSLMVMIFIIILWLNQSFLAFELSYYDWLLSSHNNVSIDTSEVVIVGYTEGDIARFKESTISDRTLYSVIDTILASEAKLVGLDFLRDFLTYPKLENLFYNESSLYLSVSLLQQGSDRIYSLPNIESNRWGDVSVPIDFDNILRRVYLSVCYPHTVEGCEGYVPSLAFLLAVSYLAEDDISLERDSNAGYLKLGQTSFPQFTSNFGGYVNMSFGGGYQYLFNWQFPLSQIQKISVSDLIDSNYDPSLFNDKIVLIGSLAPSSSDMFTLPNQSRIFGVEAIAQQVIFYLAASRGEVDSLFSFPFWVELLLFIFCSCLIWLEFIFIIKKVNYKYLQFYVIPLVAINILLLISLSFLLFSSEFWLPIFPYILSFCLIGIIQLLFVFRVKQQRYVQYLEESNYSLTKKLEQAHQYEIARERSNSISSLASKLAHELRNSLGTIQGDSYVIRRGLNELSKFYDDDEELEEVANNSVVLDEKIEKLSFFLNDILEMSRCNLYQTPTEININTFLDQIILNTLSNTDVFLIKEFDSDINEPIVALEMSLYYSFRNLINNALNAIEDNKKEGAYLGENDPLLKFITRNHPDFIEIKVCDNGIGVPKEYQNHLFDILFTNRKGGTGLGLYFVYESIVNIHKGKVSLDPSEKGFTCFLIWLPKQFRVSEVLP